MSRDIKFRIWNPSGQNMLYDIDNVFECLKQQIKFDKTMPDRGFVAEHDHRSEGMVWEQFTGLKDKNGIDIYEGDILKWISSTDEVFHNVVYFLKYRYRIKGTKNKKTFHSDFNENQIFNHKCEVIGNIHENPELLNND